MKRSAALAVLAGAVLALAACAAQHPAASRASASHGTAQSPACPAAVSTVQAIAGQGGIDLDTGAMQATVSSDEINSWASRLGAAVKRANAYNTGPGTGRQLTTDLVHTEGEAVILGLDIATETTGTADPQAAARAHTDGRTFITDLRAAVADCPQTS